MLFPVSINWNSREGGSLNLPTARKLRVSLLGVGIDFPGLCGQEDRIGTGAAESQCAQLSGDFLSLQIESARRHRYLPTISSMLYSTFHTRYCLLAHTYLLNYILTYLPTPWRRVLLEKLTGFQLVKKFPEFYGTRRFITAITNARHLSLAWASSIESTHPHPTSWRSILILSSHLCLGLPSGLYPPGFPIKTLYTPLLSPHTRYMPRPSHSFRFYHPNNIGRGVQIIKLLNM